MNKKLIAILLIFSYLLSLSSFAYEVAEEIFENVEDVPVTEEGHEESEENTYPDLTENVYSLSYMLSDGLKYTKNITDNETYGVQREYVLEYDPESSTNINFVTNEYIRTTGSISQMAKLSLPEENMVAGINADFFNMSTGVANSAFIKDYEVFTTDMGNFCLAETERGTYFFDVPNIRLALFDEEKVEYTVMQLNKDFSSYGLYIYNDRFAKSTYAQTDSTAVIMYPYEDVITFKEALNLYSDTDEVSEIIENIELAEDEEYQKLEQELKLKIEEISGGKVINGNLYYISEVFPKINNSEKLVVYQMLPNETNTPIPENSYVLCADNLTYGYILRKFNPGDLFEFSLTGNDVFDTVRNAIGTGAIIVNDSEIIENTNVSHYMSPQPRTAVGIKEDGSLVFYAIDGRQSGYSSGLKLKELAQQMLSLGCVYAANFDGGGSTAVNVSPFGFNESYIDNSPSAGQERKVANAVVFTNDLEKDGTPHSAYSYKDYYITLSDRSVLLDDIKVSDVNGYEVELETDENGEKIFLENMEIYTKDSEAFVDGFTLFPQGVTGEIEIYASLGYWNENTFAKVLSVETPEEIIINADKSVIAPFENINISAVSKYHGINLETDFDSYIWSATEYQNDQEGEIIAEDTLEDTTEEAIADEEIIEEVIYGAFENGVFYPGIYGKDIEIKAQIGDTVQSIIVKVEPYPFTDIENHWAVKEIYSLAKEGIVKGEYDNEGVAYYFPQRNYTRFEFCVMTSRILDLFSKNETISDSADNQDVTTDEDPINYSIFYDEEEIPEWAYDSVYNLYNNGYLDGILTADENGYITFNGTEHITRAEVAEVLGKICAIAPEEFSIDNFPDLDETQKLDFEIKNVVNAGIFSGYEDNTLRLSNTFTRAEAAAVFVRLKNHLSSTQKY